MSRRGTLEQRNLLLSMRLNGGQNGNLSKGGLIGTANAKKSDESSGKGGKVWRMSFSPRRLQESNRRSLNAPSKRVSPLRGKPQKASGLSLRDFEVGRKLGKGKFGRVYCVKHKASGFVCAMKVMDKNEIIHYNVQKQFKREVEIQSNLNHRNLTKLFGYFHDEKRVYLLMEYLINGEMYKKLRESGPFNDVLASCYVYQMADALHYMHQKKIIHRDLKPENILLGFNNTIKLTDFGWSIMNSQGNKRKTLCGTIDYLSPELLNSKEYDDKVDVWALGVLTYELVVGAPPFEEDSKELTYKRIVAGDLQIPSNISQDARNLITRLLELDPTKRIALKDVKTHPWIQKNRPFW